jgi:uncharacterized protein DUF3226
LLPAPIDGPCLIIGEGVHDEAFLRHLLQNRNILGCQVGFPSRENSSSDGRGGFGEVLSGLRVRLDFKNIRVVILVSDNDEDPVASFSKIKAQITEAGGFSVPTKPLEVVGTADHPDLVTVMLPWTNQIGCLETLCLPATLEAWPNIEPCIEEYSRCTDIGTWPISKQSKMQLRCLFAAACKTDPNTSLTYAWSRNPPLIPLGHRSFDQLAEFLRTIRARY